MFSLKKKQSGFTIVELLIVIVVIGILATLVIITFTGIQQKARDSKRKSDLTAIQAALESYYSTNNTYPTLAHLNDISTGGWVATNLKGFDVNGLKDPKLASGSTAPLVSGTTPSASQYAYNVTGAAANCDDSSGSTNPCTNYSISAKLESDGTTISKQSNN